MLRRFADFVWEQRGRGDRPIASDRELLRIARDLREHITLGGKPNGYCIAVCLPLSVWLTRHGRPAIDVHGGVGDWQHAWIALDDGRILDPTADQFNGGCWPKMPQVYLGALPAHYEVPR